MILVQKTYQNILEALHDADKLSINWQLLYASCWTKNYEILYGSLRIHLNDFTYSKMATIFQMKCTREARKEHVFNDCDMKTKHNFVTT